jgi:hypothetical protein
MLTGKTETRSTRKVRWLGVADWSKPKSSCIDRKHWVTNRHESDIFKMNIKQVRENGGACKIEKPKNY